jgi:hypothetical protein
VQTHAELGSNTGSKKAKSREAHLFTGTQQGRHKYGVSTP